MWWDEWNFPHVSYTSLPERMFVVSMDGIDLYAIPVYVGDSDVCMIGFVTGNKKSRDLGLQDTYWNYYEADAVTRAYTTHVLRQITGDPSFSFNHF